MECFPFTPEKPSQPKFGAALPSSYNMRCWTKHFNCMFKMQQARETGGLLHLTRREGTGHKDALT